MVQRAQRVSGFVTDRFPAENASVEVLCEDHVGTYLIPFACRHGAGGWMNAATAAPIAAAVVGWRETRRTTWRGRRG